MKKAQNRGYGIVFRLAAVLILVGSLFALSACQNQVDKELDKEKSVAVPEYKVGSKSKYARNGKECMAYRVSANYALSKEQMYAVFDDIAANDEYYLHIVWFYSSSTSAKGSSAYDIAEIEETAPGECTYTAVR